MCFLEGNIMRNFGKGETFFGTKLLLRDEKENRAVAAAAKGGPCAESSCRCVAALMDAVGLVAAVPCEPGWDGLCWRARTFLFPLTPQSMCFNLEVPSWFSFYTRRTQDLLAHRQNILQYKQLQRPTNDWD